MQARRQRSHFPVLLAVRALWTDYAPSRAVRFVLRSLYWPLVTTRWCRVLRGMDFGAASVHVAAGLLEKPHRPYLNARWSAARRLRALRVHYVVAGALPRGRWPLQAHARGCVLAHVETSADVYQLVLRGSEDSREGELELALETTRGQRVVTVLFTFIAPLPRLVVAIGCLQGGQAAAHGHIADLSKAFHGLPVKLLIVKLVRHVVRGLAPAGAAVRLLAVDDANHVFRHWRYRRKDKVSANYAATWRALGGSLRDDGFWELPLAEPEPDYAHIKSSKRSLARHRWEDLQRIHRAMDAGLVGGAPGMYRLEAQAAADEVPAPRNRGAVASVGGCRA